MIWHNISQITLTVLAIVVLGFLGYSVFREIESVWDKPKELRRKIIEYMSIALICGIAYLVTINTFGPGLYKTLVRFENKGMYIEPASNMTSEQTLDSVIKGKGY